jgi:hypothetical protein
VDGFEFAIDRLGEHYEIVERIGNMVIHGLVSRTEPAILSPAV